MFLYIYEEKRLAMKSTQLLSVVFSLIMFTGVTAGNTAFAESDDVIEDFEDCVEAGYPVMESFPEKCMTDDGTVFTNTGDDDDDYDDDYEKYDKHGSLEDRLEHFCELTDEEKKKLYADHSRLAPFTDRLANYCEMSEDEQDAIDDLIEEHGNKLRAELRDYSKDYPMDHEKDMRMMLDRYCEMTDADKKAFVAEHDKAEDHVEKMNRYCALTDEDTRRNFILKHKVEYMDHMKDKMYDKMTDKPHMDYERFCKLTDAELAASTFDIEFVEKASKWCEMTPEEQEDYKIKHHAMSGKISDKAKDKLKMKFSDKSDRLKAMIMTKHDVSDERRDEIRMKYEEKHGDLDERKSELKMKFKNHMVSSKVSMSEDRRSEIHDRLAEMKAFKAELREKSSELTDEEKQQLREEFIEKAKDMQLAWISPRTQINAGVVANDVECREGFSLVMKTSNGVPICLKADTALKMMDRGLVVPAN